MSLAPKIVTGMPAGTKARPRSDFKPSEFDQAILTKGYRMYWSRAAICPCRNNEQTDQPDPTCGTCRGYGYLYFLPDPALPSAPKDAEGNEIVLNDAGDGVMIWVLMTQLTQDVQVFEKFGEWIFGLTRCSTQPENRLGYRDRLVSVDSEMVWAQLVEADGTNAIPIVGAYKGGGPVSKGFRYGFLTVNLLRSKATVYREGADFSRTSVGGIAWITTPPVAGTLLTIHGTIRPHWVVMDHMHTIRDTFLEGSDPSIKAQKFRKLPVQVVATLDFLVDS
jgi:hypothetical protein